MQMILDNHRFPKFFVPEERDTEKGWGVSEVKRTAKIQKKKVATDIFIHYNQKGRGFEKTKTRGGESDHTGEEGKEAEGRVSGPPLVTTVLLP